LNRVCTQLAVAYFPLYARPCAEYLSQLLQSEHKNYHSVALQITKIFLEQPNAIEYVNGFDDIIKLSHQAVTRAMIDSKTSFSSISQTTVLSTVTTSDNPDDKNRVRMPRFTITRQNKPNIGSISEEGPNSTNSAGGSSSLINWEMELAGAAADVIATVIILFKNKDDKARSKNAGPRSSMVPSQHTNLLQSHRVMPIRTLRNTITALQQVVRSSPMFPKSN